MGDEPRKRAPRALTGRYVRTGTAASPRVLQLLRKKIEERLRLKEMLGGGHNGAVGGGGGAVGSLSAALGGHHHGVVGSSLLDKRTPFFPGFN